MSTTSTTVQQVINDLTTIKQLIHKWPTNRQLRETHRPSEGHQPPPPPDMLPFGLDKNIDTKQRIRTRFGAEKAIAALANAWHNRLNAGNQTMLVSALDYLTRNAGRAYEKLEPHEWEWSAKYVAWIADTTRQATGHGIEPTTKTCPYCNQTELQQQYTDTGLSDELHCPGCRKTITPEQYNRYAVLYARYNQTNIALTQNEAAILLGEQLGTINARVKRRDLKPVYGTGRNAKYYLEDLKKKQGADK